MNWIGLDLHCETIEMSVVREGKEIFKVQVPTEEQGLKEAIGSLKGPKRVVVEEGILADWCKRVLEPLVNEFVICDPRRNRLVSEAEDKDDPVDAYRLALLLWLGQVKPVYHGDVALQQLKEAVIAYWQSNGDLTRAKNRLKNQWTRRGLRAGRELYRESGYAQWREKLETAWGPTEAADSGFAQVSFLRQHKARRLKWLRQQARDYGKKMACLQSIPGVGFVVAVTLAAFLGDPERFPNKRKLWKYCGLGVCYRRSAGKAKGRRRRNHHLIRYCEQQRITFSRTRPARKNDNPHVEQKNYSVVRRAVGYARYEGQEDLELLNEMYDLVRLQINFFKPVMKLVSKERRGSRIHKHYDGAKTPYRRLCDSAEVSAQTKRALAKQYRSLNPAELARQIARLSNRLLLKLTPEEVKTWKAKGWI